MSGVKGDLVSLLLSQHFGSIPSQVGLCLQRNGPSPLRLIAFKTKIPVKKVKSSLLTLIQHRMVSVSLNSRGILNYTLLFEHVYQMVRYSKYILLVRKE